MSKVVTLPATNPLIGTWGALDDEGTSVEYTVAPTKSGLAVSATDTSDGEMGQISQLENDGSVISFTVKWSSGRICHCRMHSATRDQVQFTFTYTEHEHLQRRAPNKG